MAGNHHAHIQRGDARQHGRLLGEATLAFEFREDHAKAVLPQRIARDQDAFLRGEQHHGMGIVAGRADYLPLDPAQAQGIAVLHHVVEGEAVALLAGGAVAEGVHVPRAHRLGLRGGDQRARLPAALQRGVSAAVVGVQVRVDQAPQHPAAEAGLDQRQRLWRMRDVAGVDQRGVIAVDKQDVVCG